MKSIGTLAAGLILSAVASAQINPFQRDTAAQTTHSPVVIKVIGDEIITYGEVILALRRLRAQGKLSTNEDFDRERQKAFMSLIELRLQAQAGRDLGFAPDMVERLVNGKFDRTVANLGGHAIAGQKLQDEGITPDEYKEIIQNELMASAWRDSRIGRTAGATGRVEVDRYIRPGQEYRLFMQLRHDPRYIERLGGQPERVMIQELLLVPGGAESDEALNTAHELGKQLAKLLESGESTFEELDALHGPPGRSAEIMGRAPQPLATHKLAGVSIARHESDALQVFAQTAADGGVSEPMLHTLANGRRVVTLYRLAGRLAAEPARFTAPGTQKFLEKELLNVLDERRLQTSMLALQEHTYHWPAPEDVSPAESSPVEQP